MSAPDRPAASLLAGRTVLVLEDEYFIASKIDEALSLAGATVLGPFPRLDQALAALSSQRVDCAVLDINLSGEMQFTLADRLQDAGIPFVFSSGYDNAITPERHKNASYCLKPWKSADMLEKLAAQLG